MGTLLYFCDLRGPPKPSLRTPWGSMDPRLRTYGLTAHVCNGLFELDSLFRSFELDAVTCKMHWPFSNLILLNILSHRKASTSVKVHFRPRQKNDSDPQPLRLQVPAEDKFYGFCR